MASIVAPRSKPLVYLRKERQDNWSGAGFGAANSTRVLLSCRPGSESEVYDVTNGKILSRSTRGSRAIRAPDQESCEPPPCRCTRVCCHCIIIKVGKCSCCRRTESCDRIGSVERKRGKSWRQSKNLRRAQLCDDRPPVFSNREDLFTVASEGGMDESGRQKTLPMEPNFVLTNCLAKRPSNLWTFCRSLGPTETRRKAKRASPGTRHGRDNGHGGTGKAHRSDAGPSR